MTLSIECSKDPLNAQNMNAKALLLMSSNHTYQAQAAVICEVGYRIIGSKDNTNNTRVLTCSSKGTWDVLPTECEPIGMYTSHFTKRYSNVTYSKITYGFSLT